MKKSLFVILLLIILIFSGCGNTTISGFGVPDDIAEELVRNYTDTSLYDVGEYNSYKFNVFHNYNKETHVDAVVIDVEVYYNFVVRSVYIPVWYTFNESADRWIITNIGEWSRPSFQIFEDKLIGNWELVPRWDDWTEEKKNDKYFIHINSIKEGNADLSFRLITNARYFSDSIWDPDTYEAITIEGDGVYPLDYWGIHIPIEIPKGYHFQGTTMDDYNNRDTELTINLDCQAGFKTADYAGFIMGVN